MPDIQNPSDPILAGPDILQYGTQPRLAKEVSQIGGGRARFVIRTSLSSAAASRRRNTNTG